MKFLLDVAALMAWRHARYAHHAAFHRWIAATGVKNVVTCAHVELGFIRVSMQVFNLSLADATRDLQEIKRLAGGFVLEAPSPVLPAWAGTQNRTPDGYLAQIAVLAGLSLATFDTGIPGATLIQL